VKWLALILLILNLAVAGVFLGIDHWTNTPSAAHAPLHADRLNLRSASRTQIAGVQLADKPPSPALCVEWRGLEAVDFVRVREQLKGMTSDHVMSFTEVPLQSRQWVIFPPLPSRAAALAKLAELTAVGIQDVFVVKAGSWANALSLGLYANEEMARRRVRELEEKGVHGIRIESQPKQGTGYYFVIRSDDADALKSLNEAKTAYPNSALSRVGCQT
jgi:hypothetical protein